MFHCLSPKGSKDVLDLIQRANFPRSKATSLELVASMKRCFIARGSKENQCMNQGTDESPQLYAARVFSHKVAHPCSQQVFWGAHCCTPYCILLMVQKSAVSPVDAVKESHYLQGFRTFPAIAGFLPSTV